MILGSGMTCLHIVRVFYVSTNNLNAGFWQSQHGDARSWDVECDDKKSQVTGNGKDKIERRRLNQARSSVDESWTMKRIDHKNAKETTARFKGDDSTTGIAMINPMVKTSQKKIAALMHLKNQSERALHSQPIGHLQLIQIAGKYIITTNKRMKLDGQSLSRCRGSCYSLQPFLYTTIFCLYNVYTIEIYSLDVCT